MAEQLYTIPVNEAFRTDCECPLCQIYQTLQQNAIDFTMGPSYMEDDVRLATNQLGFCKEHIKMLYQHQNRLGLALMMLSHTDRTIAEMKKIAKSSKSGQSGLFKKKEGDSLLKLFSDSLEDSCYICQRIDATFDRYVATIFHLYRTDDEFRKVFEKGKGFCVSHYVLLREGAAKSLKGSHQEEFLKTLDILFFDNMQRVRDELKWFTDKFDYRYADQPWGNSKDAVPRTIGKMNSVKIE